MESLKTECEYYNKRYTKWQLLPNKTKRFVGFCKGGCDKCVKKDTDKDS